MKLRTWPIVITVAVSALLLFGGWFAYRQWVVENPLKKLVTEYEGVNAVQFDITRTQVDLKLKLEPGTDISGLVKHIEQDGKGFIGNRTLKLDVEDNSSPALDKLWEQALFSVAQAMENKQYTEITATLEKLEQQDNSLQTSAEIDDKNVYITLTNGENSKFIILPRIPQKMGVWSNA
ncbi:hypothetical protein EJP82_04315 [Paenibacillus anaericanus]|uniref:Uncharacterized protein n=1 Tax=Paenibacillus anaericanus TaxID=170367 RepID=A0A3S1DLZ9_9BACL|nr:hypothetical protein [Paenibacillus anaericanus]RUT47612.1 hypothetical protein EJP82_04315 [Paenibacillus anaericanus]